MNNVLLLFITILIFYMKKKYIYIIFHLNLILVYDLGWTLSCPVFILQIYAFLLM